MLALFSGLQGQVDPIRLDSTLVRTPLALRPDTVQPTIKTKSFLNSVVTFPARDSTVVDLVDNKIRIYGEGKVTYEDIEITADYIEMNIDRKELVARGSRDSLGRLTGKAIYKDSKDTYETAELRYNFETKKAYVIDVRMKQEGIGTETGYIHSHITKRDSSGLLNIKDGKFTTCDAEDPHFYFAITKGQMVPDKMIVSGPAYLVVEDVPLYLIGLPFGFFPKQEKEASGIIMPKYGEEARRGFYLREGGYYWAGTEKMDLTLTGGIYSRGSWQLGARTNYRVRYKHAGGFGFNVANNVLGEKDLPNYTKQKDFSVQWNHAQDPKAHPLRTFNASVNLSSSKYDQLNTYSNYQNPLEHMTNTKSSSISYNQKFTNKLFNFTARLGHTQNSNDRSVVLNLPQANFSINRFYPFKKGSAAGKKWYEKIEMRYSSSFENRIKAREDSIFNPEIFSKMKTGFQHEIPVSASFKPFNNLTITPSLSYKGLLYFSQIEKSWDPVMDSIIIDRINRLSYVQALSPTINLSYTPRIYGMFYPRFGRVVQVRHVMNPSISFSYRPDLGYDMGKYHRTLLKMEEDANGKLVATEQDYMIFEQGGLYSLPSVAGRYGSINFTLGNNLEMKVKNPSDTTGQLKKMKLLESLNLSTSYDIFRDSMNLSPPQLTARTRILDQFDINFRSAFNPYLTHRQGVCHREPVVVELVQVNGVRAQAAEGRFTRPADAGG
ncbi:MAG: putative LPS assembly protein LptD [Bacteroidales bacterium]